MEAFQTEEQQVEAIKKWWAKNSKSVTTALLIGLGIILGARVWIEYRHNQAEAASVLYANMLGALKQEKGDAALEQGARILGQYPDSSYATLAALASAKIKLESGDAAAARAHLQWVLDHGKPEQARHIARLRLARVMVDAGEAQAALTLLGQGDAGEFLPAYKELEGDIYRGMDQTAKAREAYRSALAALEPQARNRTQVQTKLDDLGAESPAQGS